MMTQERLETIDDWFDEEMMALPLLPPLVLLDLLERCLVQLAEENPTFH